jgi:hypothetical protein
MRPFWLLGIAFLTLRAFAQEPEPAEPPDPEQPFSAEETEAKSGPVITPISTFPQKKPYDQARDTLKQAQTLWAKQDAEAASEAALEAYDDLMSIRIARKQKKARVKLRAERRQAADVYIVSSIAYIKEYVKKRGDTAEAKADGRARLGDLRDVSRDYLDLQKKVVNAIGELQ